MKKRQWCGKQQNGKKQKSKKYCANALCKIRSNSYGYAESNSSKLTLETYKVYLLYSQRKEIGMLGEHLICPDTFALGKGELQF